MLSYSCLPCHLKKCRGADVTVGGLENVSAECHHHCCGFSTQSSKPPQHWNNCCAQKWNAVRVCVWPGIASLAKCLAFLWEVGVAAPLSACKQADPSGHSLCLELGTGFTISTVNC